jgi:hypothetical protein
MHNARIEPAGGGIARHDGEIELARAVVMRGARDGLDEVGPREAGAALPSPTYLVVPWFV